MNRQDILEQCFFEADGLDKAALTELWTQAVIEASELRAQKERALRLVSDAAEAACGWRPGVEASEPYSLALSQFQRGVFWAVGELSDEEIGLDTEEIE